MHSEDREPDTTDAGGGRDVGQGYPEEQQGGATPDEGGSRSGGDQPDERDGEPGQATGNRDAAG
jgi:hypothetical protein